MKTIEDEMIELYRRINDLEKKNGELTKRVAHLEQSLGISQTSTQSENTPVSTGKIPLRNGLQYIKESDAHESN